MSLSRGDLSPLVSLPRSPKFPRTLAPNTSVTWFGLLLFLHLSTLSSEYFRHNTFLTPNIHGLYLSDSSLLIYFWFYHAWDRKSLVTSLFVLMICCLLYPWAVISVHLARWSRPLLRVDASKYVLIFFFEIWMEPHMKGSRTLQNILGFSRLLWNLTIVYGYVNKLSNMVVQDF